MTPRSICLYALLLSCAMSQVDAIKARKPQEPRRWESTGIVNCTGPVFACDNDPTRTIKMSFRCDGTVHCKGGSDEQKCTECRTPFSKPGKDGFLECIRADDMHRKAEKQRKYQRARPADWKSSDTNCTHDDHLRCPGSEVCIPPGLICDGVTDCLVEAIDERNCTACNNGAKMCVPSGKCIASGSLCDGIMDCKDGSDEHDCGCATCSGPHRALCSNGRCIDSKFVCDGVMDCEDASDEQHCPAACGATVSASVPLPTIVECETYYAKKRYLLSTVCSGEAPECNREELCPDQCDTRTSFYCPPYAYYASYQYPGKCISKSMVCDGHSHCMGGEDEKNCREACKKAPHYLRVNHRASKCISMESRCDGVPDFANGIDEKRCNKCSGDSFRCDGGCISSSSRCNGVKECKDGSDEANCSCEECTSGRLDTYSCEATRTCMKRSEACGPRSKCPKPTVRDELFCNGHALKTRAGSEV